jgi:hypothetical protein
MDPTPQELMANAVELGRRIARRFFEKRGKGQNVEVHLSEGELASLLALAAEQGMKKARSIPDVTTKAEG